MEFKLKRVRQCEHCPWKVSTNPHEIPNGYSVAMHRQLSSTIAQGPELFRGPLRAMSCHEHPIGDEAHCVGWLMNQLGEGNNIGLRMLMRNCTNIAHVQLDGPQHARFEDTLPEE